MDNLPDWISALSTLGGLIFAVYAYWNWKATVINQREFEVLTEVVALLSLLHRHAVSDIRDEATLKAMEIHTSIVDLVHSNRHLLERKTTSEILHALQHAEHFLTCKKSGVETLGEESDCLMRIYRVNEYLIERIKPTPFYRRVWRLFKPRRRYLPRTSVKE